MKPAFALHQTDRLKGSYYRKDCIGDVLYYCFIYRDIHITFAKKGRKNTLINDDTAELLHQRGFISSEDLVAYKEKVSSLFSLETLKDFDEYSLEELYAFIASIRKSVLGAEGLNRLWHELACESEPLVFENCLDQSEQISNICKEKEKIFVALTEPQLFATMNQVLGKIQAKKIVYILSEYNEFSLPAKNDLTKLFKNNEFDTLHLKNGNFFGETDFDTDTSALLVFGESGLLDARKLKIPCGVFCKPKGYHASAVAGQLGLSRPCAVLVPQNFSIVEYVPVIKKSRLTFLILAKLAAAYGEKIYSLSIGELYAKYPKDFFNVYETSVCSDAETVPALNISKDAQTIDFTEFDRLRANAIKDHLESFPNCQYYSKVFTETTKGIKGKILVHGVRIKKSDGAAVIPCGKSMPLRAKMRELNQKGTGIVSNFLFFLTPKLATLYNNLRYDRPEEKAEVDAGHLDYLLEYRNGKRLETFPLFQKTCIALKENGEFIFFNFRLGGGSISINSHSFAWGENDVNPAETPSDVCIYTPYCSLPDSDADRETYRKAVGHDRLNFVIIQDRVTAIREGDVLIPGMGVVVSLKKNIGENLCESLGLLKNENGYFPSQDVRFDVCLNAPAEIDPEEWSKVKWAFGGGLSLILNGVGLCDGNHMEKWFEKDGWTSPLSRQTQESALHTLVKHPRTAIGTTKDGELVILVFSGRTEFSDGADYSEMCIIARELIPNIQYLMNVDGGGSAMLGMVIDGTFTELSLPSTSTGSTVGMVRPINTVLHIPLS